MIREATGDDAAQIAAFWNPMIRDTAVTFNAAEKSVNELAGMIAERQAKARAFLVAEEAGQIMGFATYDQFRGGVGYRLSMEHTIILHPLAQGRGIGRALMGAIENHAIAMGYHVMIAGVSAENPAGRAFHEKLGYQFMATLPQVGHKFGRFMDLWLLQKILT